MGFFRKKLSGAGERSGNELNAFLGAGTEYTGSLDFVGTVRIDGIFDGEISSEGTLVLGKDAVIRGTIHIGSLISNGRIFGDVVASGKAVLQKHSTLDGSLATQALVVEEGATVEGDVVMHDGAKRTTLEAVNPPLYSDEDSAALEDGGAERVEADKVEVG
ncbi:MAG: polymer-forming cytoskeletal protein [Desulfovibrio sp.]|jgi:cytoskeletal protein CcmA (bactofilin family)|nr:polymer-forming cytoskeletal protein [Desulfovibrio sp.]